MRLSAGPIPVEAIRKWKLEATARLLGDTIGISDPQWGEPSLLPGWSRGHVATHLARNADTMRQLTAAVQERGPDVGYPSAQERSDSVEAGAGRNGLELQIDLDTSAGALKAAWDKVTDWGIEVTLYGRAWPLSILPLIRLHEVILHHIDLDCGFGADDVDPSAARWLLDWALTRLEKATRLPRVRISSDSGVVGAIGAGARELAVSGADARLWVWLCGRAVGDTVEGANGAVLPQLS